ncbi:GDP-D-glucose phosphorylase 1 [Pelobates cultripes]|uniref:GDP-D-glucose phosphorylase 1 n=1 Tax=Pelobates cultripes TaxID=61616 RepID=A0AAD1VYY1_PELCU|nr:GDP-D-glucose phosphorylase 1 [Pelobates cultripes]
MEEHHVNGLSGAYIENYNYTESDFIIHGLTWQDRQKCRENENTLSKFDRALRSKWVEKMKQGFFRYPLWSLETRILPGKISYVAQLNIKRGMERRKPQDIQSIQEKFKASQFNFNKINPNEVLFQMVRTRGSELMKNGQEVNNVLHGSLSQESVITLQQPCPVESASSSKGTLVVINVSPLEFGHVLFIPDPSLCLTQILTCDLMLFGLKAILLSSHPGFRVGFNSLGAFASVNHLHLHGFYLDHELLIESSSSKPLCPELNLHLLTNFPAPGFMFYTNEKDLASVAQNIFKATDYFVGKNIAHNMFATRGSEPGSMTSKKGIRVILWARRSCFGAKEESAFNVALCELAGHLPMKNHGDFISATEESVIGIIKKYLFSDEEFAEISSGLLAHLTKDA